MKLSVIIPMLNEAAAITQTLLPLQALREAGHEVIAVDGGSVDESPGLAKPLVDRLICAPRGRARQMNAGAQQATGDTLLFLHADTLLPEEADRLIVNAMDQHGKSWGRFDVRLSGSHLLLRAVEFMINRRSRFSGIATGDQAMFVSQPLFCAMGGFPEIELMEDVALSIKLRRFEPPLCLRQRVVTSSRRWEQNGIPATILLMWRLRLAFALGADPARLARVYEAQGRR